MKKNKQKSTPKLNQIFYSRRVILALLAFVCIIGLPLRSQNIKLNGYISDDAWWHYRQIQEVSQTGHRLNPDVYEFTTLKRPMTYPPLFHYLVASSYKLSRLFYKGLSLIIFSHYFNLLEGMLYILLIYWISVIITTDRLFSLIGALCASLSYGVIIRARAGELMPFVPSDLLALAGLLPFLFVLKDINRKKSVLLCITAGILFGLSSLSWSGAVLIYFPLAFFAFLALFINKPKYFRLVLKLFLFFLAPLLIVSLPWYLPIALRYGINPHSKEMYWFMKNFTVLHQVKPLSFYILTSGIAIFFVPAVFLISFFKKSALNIFLILWIILAAVAGFSGWRGYVAVVPIVSAVAISIGFSRIVYSLFKKESLAVPIIFIAVFLLAGAIGYRISDVRIKPLDPNNINETRTNALSIKMLEFLKQKYPQAVTIDHITWISEDAAVGGLRMVAGQYLEYLPQGSGEALKDVSRIYFSNEEEAYKICRKYNVDLIIVRRQFLQLPQLSILFAPPELKSDDYLKVVKDDPLSAEMTMNFTQVGMQTMLFKMLNRQKIERFELVYSEQDKGNFLPFVVVYKVNK